MEDPSLRDIRLFVASVQHGSLSASSRAFGLSPNAASLAVKRLEELLRVRLLFRTTRTISLTAEGEIYLGQCQSLLEAVDATQSSVGPLRDELAGPIRIAAPSDLGRRTLMPMLDAFALEHPGVQLDVWLSDDLSDVVKTRTDSAVRYGAMMDSDLVMRRLCHSHRIAVASAEYLRHAPNITHPRDLAQHRALVWQRPGRRMVRWQFQQDGQESEVEVRAHRTSNDGAVLRHWALEGHGVVFKAHLDVAKEWAAGDLVDVLPQWRGVALPLYLVLPGRGSRPARVQRMVQALVEGFAALQADTPTTNNPKAQSPHG